MWYRFLTSALKELEKQVKTAEDKRLYDESVFGIEKPLPYLLAITNMLIHDIDSSNYSWQLFRKKCKRIQRP